MTDKSQAFSLSPDRSYTATASEYRDANGHYFVAFSGMTLEKLKTFPRFVSRDDVAMTLVRAEHTAEPFSPSANSIRSLGVGRPCPP